VLIAVELEHRVKGLGYGVVGPATSIRSALAFLDDAAPPDAALLEIQLGEERVTPVARRLRALGVKYALVTGYARLALEEPELNGVPRLSKPGTSPELERMLEGLVAEPK